ncbi:MAG: hypothetical protein U5P41_02745 [Gammaproteobacteria bacterium]|nr:hypothetical protein [Gammaproteobacteria bacterium]
MAKGNGSVPISVEGVAADSLVCVDNCVTYFCGGIYYLPAWWNSVAIILSLYCAAQIGSRSGNIDGFQIGYEWGKEEAISKAFKLKPGEIDEIVRTGSEIESESNRIHNQQLHPTLDRFSFRFRSSRSPSSAAELCRWALP